MSGTRTRTLTVHMWVCAHVPTQTPMQATTSTCRPPRRACACLCAASMRGQGGWQVAVVALVFVCGVCVCGGGGASAPTPQATRSAVCAAHLCGGGVGAPVLACSHARPACGVVRRGRTNHCHNQSSGLRTARWALVVCECGKPYVGAHAHRHVPVHPLALAKATSTGRPQR